MRCTRSSLRGFFSAGVPVAYGFATMMLLLYIYSRLFYTDFYPGNELVESALRYVAAAVLLGAWLLSWFRFAVWWKRWLMTASGQGRG